MADTQFSTVSGEPSPDQHGAIQKRTIRVLMVSVIPAGMSSAGVFPVTAPLAKDLTGSETLAGFTAACLTVGAAVAAVPITTYMSKVGRRPGLRTGWLVAALGAVAAFVASLLELFPLLVVGALLMGAGSATTLTARYAAADLATEDARAKAIAVLVWAGTFGSVLGPSLATGPVNDLGVAVGLPERSAAYVLALIGFLSAASLSERLLRPDPLVTAGGVRDAAARQKVRISESFAKLWSVPMARLAVLAMATGHAVMVGVMTMTPIHMENGNHEVQIIGFVISLHIVGMYAFSPVVGWFVDRLGALPVIAAGGVLLFIGAEMASHTDPEDSMGVFVGLFLIGLGWSCGLISGSTLLTSAFTSEERPTTQGASDLIMVASGAAAGLISGAVVELSSYHGLAHWAGISALILPVVAGLLLINQRRTQFRPT